MTSRFAGSRQIDDRRRRRLAQEADPSTSTRQSSALTGDDATANPNALSEAMQGLRDESLIPRSLWKISGICLAGLLAWGGMLWIGLDSAWHESALEDVVGLRSGRVAKFFSTVTLLSASQLSTMILWYRSKSRKDFAGRYRLWAWASMYWSLLCLGAATGFHIPLAQLLYEYWRFECWRPEIVYWLAPAAAGFVALYALLGHEVRQSRAGRLLWNVCALAGVATLLLSMGLDLSIPAPWRLPVNVGVATFWHLSAAIVLLVHARFVVHVNNESAPRRGRIENRFVIGYLALICRLLSIRWPRIPLPRWRRTRTKTLPPGGDDKNPPAREPARKSKQSIDSVPEKSAPAAPAASSAPAIVTAARPANSTASTVKPVVNNPSSAMSARGTVAANSAARPTAPASPAVPSSPPLARQVRVDPPALSAPSPKTNPVQIAKGAESPGSPRQDYSDSETDDWSDDEDDGNSTLSRKERRKLRKLRKAN